MKKEIKKPVKSFEPTAGWRLTMKDIPEKDRPYEKCEREGVGALTDAELLAILIRTGNRQESALSLATRIWRTLTLSEAPAFTAPEAIAAFYMEEMRHKEQEEMHLMILNTKQRLIRDILLFRGTFNHSPASPREIFIEALRYHAASIVLVHNHPSGDPTPSAEDRRTTVRIQEAGAMLGIRLLDHVIIGEQAYFSFKERGILSL